MSLNKHGKVTKNVWTCHRNNKSYKRFYGAGVGLQIRCFIRDSSSGRQEGNHSSRAEPNWKPVWHQFKTPVHCENQRTHGRFEPFHCVAVDTRVLPWRRYYRQLQFDRQMKHVKQQNILLITSQREREPESLQGLLHLLRCIYIFHISGCKVDSCSSTLFWDGHGSVLLWISREVFLLLGGKSGNDIKSFSLAVETLCGLKVKLGTDPILQRYTWCISEDRCWTQETL